MNIPKCEDCGLVRHEYPRACQHVMPTCDQCGKTYENWPALCPCWEREDPSFRLRHARVSLNRKARNLRDRLTENRSQFPPEARLMGC